MPIFTGNENCHRTTIFSRETKPLLAYSQVVTNLNKSVQNVYMHEYILLYGSGWKMVR